MATNGVAGDKASSVNIYLGFLNSNWKQINCDREILEELKNKKLQFSCNLLKLKYCANFHCILCGGCFKANQLNYSAKA